MIPLRPCFRFLRLVLGVLLWTGGCGPELDTRTALIVQTLIDQDRDLIATRPALVAQKYQLMASGLQPFLRGTAALFYRDLSRYQDEQAALWHGGGAEFIPLYGDVHLENVGVAQDAEGVLLDVVDFDATVSGPFGWEVRRAALALHAALSLADLSPAVLSEVTRRFGDSYVSALQVLHRTSLPLPLTREQSGSAGKIVTELLADGRKRYQQAEELAEYTELASGVRRLRRDEELIALPDPWLRDLPLLLDSYRNTRRAGRGDDTQFEILDGVQRLSAGVASLPNLRFWVLLAGDHRQAAGAASGGEWIVELKEERDPPQPVAWLGRGPIGDNGQRVFVGTLALLASPSSEPDLGYVKRGGVSFQVRRVLRGRRDLDVERLTDRLRSGRYGASDCLDLATTLGQLLAAGHGRRAKAYAIASAIAQHEDPAGSFADSLAQAAAIDAQRLERDLLLFGRALVQLGPLLSARRN